MRISASSARQNISCISTSLNEDQSMSRQDIGEEAHTAASQDHSCPTSSSSQSWLIDSESCSLKTGADACPLCADVTVSDWLTPGLQSSERGRHQGCFDERLRIYRRERLVMRRAISNQIWASIMATIIILFSPITIPQFGRATRIISMFWHRKQYLCDSQQ